MTTSDTRQHAFTPGQLMTTPAPDARAASAVGKFMDWLERERRLRFDNWDDLWRWSVTDIEAFWAAVWDYFGVRSHTPHASVLADHGMPFARWFPGATLNYAEHVAGVAADPGQVAVIASSQTRPEIQVTFGELDEQVRRARIALAGLGVGQGDVVAAYLPNIPETLISFLAAASLGAIFATCAPEFGPVSVVDRFGQIGPKVLLAVDGYRYGAREIRREDDVARIAAQLPSLEALITVPYLTPDPGTPLPADGPGGPGTTPRVRTLRWDTLLAAAADRPEPLAFEPVPFDHPLYVLFSSGTTGKPKAIVHGHGGILLEHYKNHAFHWDLRPGDRLLWFTTTAWMMWNAQASALLVGASIVMIDGDPMYPDPGFQWRLAERTRPTLMGLSTAFLQLCRQVGLTPAADLDLSSIRQFGVVGSPLSVEGYQWIYDNFASGVLTNVGSGGTDVCTGIVHGSPMQPVWAGEMSGPGLGIDARAFDPDGNEIIGETGELVITQPLPSMPVGLWGDADGSLIRETYFGMYPGVWRHGDWIRFDERGSCVISGRSDATLNRGGVRLGTADFYRVLDAIDGITDSLVVHIEEADGPGQLILFVAFAPDLTLDDQLMAAVKSELRRALSPRHVPDIIAAVPAIPRNRTGKKLEVPVKRLLQGRPLETVASRDSLADPSALEYIAARAREWTQSRQESEQKTSRRTETN
ncbi:MAG TPA: acetoacetate--CoA ligase [Trebonia sp.]|nr:acetoacetate--CoA ligase [Trebonia sp.]